MCNDEVEVVPVEEDLRRGHLTSDATYILDMQEIIFVWIGRKAALWAKKSAAVFAEELIAMFDREYYIPIVRVVQNYEPVLFREQFSDWGIVVGGVDKSLGQTRAITQSVTVDISKMVTGYVTKEEHAFLPEKGTELLEIWEVEGKQLVSLTDAQVCTISTHNNVVWSICGKQELCLLVLISREATANPVCSLLLGRCFFQNATLHAIQGSTLPTARSKNHQRRIESTNRNQATAGKRDTHLHGND